jgi:hypothetical protein
LFKSWARGGRGFRRGHNRENVYIEGKKTFSRTNRPISIKLGTNHHWVKGVLN